MQEVSFDQYLLNLLDIWDLQEVSVDENLLDLLQVLVDQHLLDLKHARLQVLPRHLHLGDKVVKEASGIKQKQCQKIVFLQFI